MLPLPVSGSYPEAKNSEDGSRACGSPLGCRIRKWISILLRDKRGREHLPGEVPFVMGGELDPRPGRGRKIGQELRIDDGVGRRGSVWCDEDEAGLDDAALPVGRSDQGVKVRVGIVQGQADLGDGVDAIDAVPFELQLRMFEHDRDVAVTGERDGLLRPVARVAVLQDDVEDDERRPFLEG